LRKKLKRPKEQQSIKDKADQGDLEAIENLKQQNEQQRIMAQERLKNLKDKADQGDLEAIEKLKQQNEQQRIMAQ
jgi:hypothetical protein